MLSVAVVLSWGLSWCLLWLSRLTAGCLLSRDALLFLLNRQDDKFNTLSYNLIHDISKQASASVEYFFSSVKIVLVLPLLDVKSSY